VLADAFLRAESHRTALAPGAAFGTMLLAVAIARYGAALGPALAVAGALYLGAVVAAGQRIDPTAPLVAVLLILCGELAAWSLDERRAIRADAQLAWRRGAAVGALALTGIASATLVVALAALPAAHGLAWTAAGAAAAVGAAGTGIWFARHERPSRT
jgi:hypothetical protein